MMSICAEHLKKKKAFLTDQVYWNSLTEGGPQHMLLVASDWE